MGVSHAFYCEHYKYTNTKNNICHFPNKANSVGGMVSEVQLFVFNITVIGLYVSFPLLY